MDLMFSSQLPALQIYWDSTSLAAFLNCPRKYQYQILEGWIPQQTALDLEFGIRYHSSLETADHLRISGADLHTQINQAAKQALSEPEFALPTGQKNRFNLVRSVVWYLLNYANRFPKHLGPDSVEVPFRFPTEITYGTERLIVCGHMDGVVEMPDGIYALERKTTGKTLNEQYFDSFTPNPQITIYTLASHIVIHAPAKGVLLDACQTVVNFSAFDRRTIQRTPGQLEEFMNDLGQWFKNAVQYAEANHWPMNEASCRICQFNRVCSKDPAVRDSFLRTDFIKRHWNPLIERTKDDARNTRPSEDSPQAAAPGSGDLLSEADEQR
jgi:hypothetical protein